MLNKLTTTQSIYIDSQCCSAHWRETYVASRVGLGVICHDCAMHHIGIFRHDCAMHHIGIFRLFIIGFAIYYIAIGEFCKNQMSRNFKHFNLKKNSPDWYFILKTHVHYMSIYIEKDANWVVSATFKARYLHYHSTRHKHSEKIIQQHLIIHCNNLQINKVK